MSRLKWWGLLLTGVTAPLLLFILFVFISARHSWREFADRRLQERAELREEYPVESLEQRLAVLHPHGLPSGMKRRPVVAPVPLSPVSHAALTQLEESDDIPWDSRQHALSLIHDRKRDDFFKSAGFGVYRMFTVRRGHLTEPAAEPIVLPDSPAARAAPSFGEGAELPGIEQTATETGLPAEQTGQEQTAGKVGQENERLTAAMQAMYRRGLEDFTDPNQIGYVPEPQHAAGFLPHSVDELPVASRRTNGTPEAAMDFDYWQITRLELVSLLKHAEPVVYESRELPRMDRLADAPTRQLTGFERRSLRELRGERDLVTEEEGGRVLMLGAIRAAKQCLNCHDVRRGTLLGAFSYEIWLPGAAPVAPPEEELKPAT